MRHHNRARLIDIAEKDLDPQEDLVVGADGRLESKSRKNEALDAKLEKQEEKLEKQDTESKAEPVETEAVEKKATVKAKKSAKV